MRRIVSTSFFHLAIVWFVFMISVHGISADDGLSSLDSEVLFARALWLSSSTPEDRRNAINILKSFGLREPDHLEANRRALVAKGADASLLAAYDEASTWARDMLKNTAEELFAEGRARFRTAVDEYEERVALWLVIVARTRGHLEARWFLLQRDLARASNRDSLQEALAGIRWFAEQGFGPAQAELARHYSVGDLVEADVARAVYWSLRAALEGTAEPAALLGQPLNAHPTEAIVLAMTWLRLDQAPSLQ